MKVDTMRAIDYWVGIPMCLVASLILAPFNRRKRSDSISNVLFIELSEMGSAILADPAMRKIQKQTDCNLFFVIFAKNRPSLSLLGTVPDENIFTIREDNLIHLARDTVRFLRWIREHNIDTVIDLELFSRYTALLTGFSGAANRVGYYSFHNEGLYRGHMLTHKVLYNPHMHISKNFISLVNAVLGGKQLPYSKTIIEDSEISIAKITPSQSELKEFLKTACKFIDGSFDPNTQKLILINANASELLIQRRWMPENYAALAKLILSNHPETIVFLTGSHSEILETDELRSQIDHPRCYSTAGKFSFNELPLLYGISHMMVTNDSGPAHFSAITDLKVFVLYGPETPALYGSLGNSAPIYKGLACSPCVNAANHRRTACRDNVCLQVIGPDEVYNTIKSVLSAKPAVSIDLSQ